MTAVVAGELLLGWLSRLVTDPPLECISSATLTATDCPRARCSCVRYAAPAMPPSPPNVGAKASRRGAAEVEHARMLSTPTSQCDALQAIPAIAHPRDAMRLGFPVKVMGGGGLKSSDTRRWRQSPHLRVSLGYLCGVTDYLRVHHIHMYRMSSDLAPYATHPGMPHR